MELSDVGFDVTQQAGDDSHNKLGAGCWVLMALCLMTGWVFMMW